MAITISDTEPRVQYTATAGQTSFTVPFAFFANADLQVFNGTSQLSFNASPSNATQYSVTGAGVSGGGSITLGSPGATLNDIITISREVAIERTTDFPTSGAFQIDSLNTELDKIIAMAQQLERDLKFSPKASATTSNTFDITFPNLVANKVLTVNSLGTGLEFSQAIGEFKGNWSASTSYVIRDIVKDTSTNNIFIVNSDHTSSGSQPLTTNANSAKYDLLVDAASATTSATNAATSATTATTKASEASTSASNAASSATAAASSATSAASSASTATTKASEASTSATNAATSETNAASSATAAASSAASASAAANFQVLNDTTPQLGGNLDTNEKEIITTSNRDLVLAPNGTGAVEIKGNTNSGKLLFNCEQNSHHVSLQAPAHSAFGGNIAFTLPTSTGSTGQALITNGSGVLSFATIAETKPTVANVSQTIAPATATTINITGTNFVSIPQVDFVNGSTGAITQANTVSFTSATALSVNVTLALGNYYVRIENPNGLAGRSTNNIITASTAPSFTTNAGSLGTFAGNFSGTLATIAGSSDSSITFSEVTSNLSGANVTLSSAGALTTTDFGGSSTTATTYNFTVRITDAEGQTVDRAFSLTSSFGATGGGQFN
jgi:hypothetical protein